jgi:uncharacterized membrane protein SpoIIM required for sporulation
VRQDQFERARSPRWDELESTLERLEHRDPEAAARFPWLYRRICQDLALARDRHFSSAIVDRLNRLALRGHQTLYRARLGDTRRLLDFLGSDFPRAARAEWRLWLFLALIFYGVGAFVIVAIHGQPELAYSFLDRATLASIEQSYDPAAAVESRAADSDLTMFGWYIWNNISIAFRTFAAGLLFGVGTLLIVVYNALFIGAVFGHLIEVGSGTRLAGFVVGHSAFELNAILIAAVAGMRLGLALIAPGSRSRARAVRESSGTALPLVYGAAAMLTLAAGIEAFWSPRALAVEIKYAVGASLWVFVLAYFGLAGRSRPLET